MESNTGIRIGTVVKGNLPDPAGYIRQILPHGFESFQIMFWQTLGDKDLKALSGRVLEALGGSGAGISSLGLFGNPLEATKIDRQTLEGWGKCIDAPRLFRAEVVRG